MRLDEYSQCLKSDSPTIELSTVHGKTIVCSQKMEGLLERAKGLLQNIIEAKNVPTIGAVHQLRDLARVLDQLKLREECLMVGDCAIKLTQALGLRHVEFQRVSVPIITVIASLNAYESRMRPLFIQAISVCEAAVIEDGSSSAKMNLFLILACAGIRARDYPALSAQWLGRAIDLIAELPSAMLAGEQHIMVYDYYVRSLCKLRQFPKALAVGERAVALFRSPTSWEDGLHQKQGRAHVFQIHGVTLGEMGDLGNALNVEDALGVQQEVVSFLCAPLAHRKGQKVNLALALAHRQYGWALSSVGRLEDALSAQQEAVSLFRAVVAHREEQKANLGRTLRQCGWTLSKMSHLEDALSAHQEAVSLFRAIVAHREEQKANLGRTLRQCGWTLSKIGRASCRERVLNLV